MFCFLRKTTRNLSFYLRSPRIISSLFLFSNDLWLLYQSCLYFLSAFFIPKQNLVSLLHTMTIEKGIWFLHFQCPFQEFLNASEIIVKTWIFIFSNTSVVYNTYLYAAPYPINNWLNLRKSVLKLFICWQNKMFRLGLTPGVHLWFWRARSWVGNWTNTGTSVY